MDNIGRYSLFTRVAQAHIRSKTVLRTDTDPKIIEELMTEFSRRRPDQPNCLGPSQHIHRRRSFPSRAPLTPSGVMASIGHGPGISVGFQSKSAKHQMEKETKAAIFPLSLFTLAEYVGQILNRWGWRFLNVNYTYSARSRDAGVTVWHLKDSRVLVVPPQP